jgi:homoserine O-acetyltransferase
MAPVPASGAWRDGDPVGGRRFVELAVDRPLALEAGGRLRSVHIAYETGGELAPDASNAVLVCHALTGDSHAHGPSGPGHPTPGWWDGFVGPGCAIDTDRFFVVCANVLGGCQGSTGPASTNPATGRPYGSRFPVVTIRDMVRTQAAVADHLGIERWLSVIGGSMGGMQVLEWGITYPRRVRSLVPIAACAAASALQIALQSIGRHTVRLDPRWRGGDYYDAAPGDGPHRGLATARQLAQVTYRTDEVLEQRFGRRVADDAPESDISLWQRFEVERYLQYHGEKLARRFDANSYLAITKAMDLHDVGRGRGGEEAALARVQVPVLSVGIDSDVLYPPHQQRAVAAALRLAGAPVQEVELTSPHGHDGFLIEIDQLGAPVAEFLTAVEKALP